VYSLICASLFKTIVSIRLQVHLSAHHGAFNTMVSYMPVEAPRIHPSRRSTTSQRALPIFVLRRLGETDLMTRRSTIEGGSYLF
jgi:hypothetical protein